jgi:tRNA pseudouridine55 synthase
MVNGILLVDKPVGISSNFALTKIKHAFPKGQKIGHAGTLDPFASGLLIVMLGSATKNFDYFQTLEKVYYTKAEFGYKTDTLDNTGEITEKSKKLITKDELNEVLSLFKGEIKQIPPQFSAKKINGTSAYLLKRKGVKFELEPRLVNIYSIDLIGFSFPSFELRTSVSSGTYIRTLVSDIGEKLGSFATCVELRREKIGDFSVNDAVDISGFIDTSSTYLLDKVLPNF